MALINQIRAEHPELFDADLETRIWEEAQVALDAESKLIKWILQGFKNEFLSDILSKSPRTGSTRACDASAAFEFPVDPDVIEVTEWMDDRCMYLRCLTSSTRSLSTTQRVPKFYSRRFILMKILLGHRGDRQLMEKGYLDPGQTVEERVRRLQTMQRRFSVPRMRSLRALQTTSSTA